MSIEAKTVDVENRHERKTIMVYQSFGWTLKSSQRIYNKDSHFENRNGDLYSVTETLNYTKLVFERDTKMTNYERLKELERRYFLYEGAALGKNPKYSPDITFERWARESKADARVSGFYVIIGIIASIIFYIVLIIADWALVEEVRFDCSYFPLLGFAIAPGVGVGWLAGAIYKKYALKRAIADKESKYYKEIEKEYLKDVQESRDYYSYISRMDTVLKEAKSLID